MKNLIGFLTIIFVVFALHVSAHALDLGGLKISFGDSPTVMSDVQIVGRSGGRSFVGGGVCSKYAWRANLADVFNADILSICGIASGTYDGNEDAKFGGAFGVSPFSFFGGAMKTFIGYDVTNNHMMRGAMTTLSAVVKF